MPPATENKQSDFLFGGAFGAGESGDPMDGDYLGQEYLYADLNAAGLKSKELDR